VDVFSSSLGHIIFSSIHSYSHAFGREFDKVPWAGDTFSFPRGIGGIFGVLAGLEEVVV